MAPLAIGLALTLIHFASMGATGTSVNPARSIGVGLFAGTDSVVQLWLFILAPLVGAAAAGLLYPLLFGGDEPVPGSGLRFPRAQRGAVPGYGAPDQYQQQWNQPDGAQFGQQPPYQGNYPQGQQPPGQGQGYPPQQYPQDRYQQEQYRYPQDQHRQPQQQQEWGQPGPDDDEDGRTQVRPPEPQ